MAWSLVCSLYRQRTSMVLAIVVCSMVGAAGWFWTGRILYLAITSMIIVVGCWRLSQVRRFWRRPEAASMETWALRSLCSGWATACCWAALSVAIASERNLQLAGLLLSLQAGLTASAAARNSALPTLAIGQIVIAAGSSAIACFYLGTSVTLVHGFLNLMFIGSAISLSRDVQQQSLHALFSESAAREMAEQLSAANEQLALVNEHLEEQATTDALTKLPNRRWFEQAAARAWRLGLRELRPLCALMIDVDHFKAFNDCYGHQAGDACLQMVAGALRGVAIRPGDVLARFGGEEFIMLLPATDETGGQHIADQVVSSLAALAHPHEHSPLGRVSCSVGVACVAPSPDKTVSDLIARADDALYSAKRSGRNQVHVWKDDCRPAVTEDGRLIRSSLAIEL